MAKIRALPKAAIEAWWRPKHPFRLWLASLVVSVVSLGILACFDRAYAIGISLSFVRGEWSLFYWMGKVGLRQSYATAIVIFCSSVSIVQYFWCGTQIQKKIKCFFERLLAKHAPELKKLLKIENGARNIRKFEEKSAPDPPGRFQRIAKKFPYLVLPLYCFDPVFGAASGVIFSTSAKLKPSKALAAMLAANVAEKILWGCFVNVVKPIAYHIVLPIVCVSLGGIVTAHVVRFLHAHNHNHQ